MCLNCIQLSPEGEMNSGGWNIPRREASRYISSVYEPTLRIILYDSVANSVRIKFFFYRPVNGDNPNFVSFLVFVGAAASFTAEISSFETVAK